MPKGNQAVEAMKATISFELTVPREKSLSASQPPKSMPLAPKRMSTEPRVMPTSRAAQPKLRMKWLGIQAPTP